MSVARRSQAAGRPAFYALRRGGWRDLVTLLHPPYTAWHLSYVALGAAAAPVVHLDRTLAALGAFLLAVGVAAHALDELHDRPLGTGLGRRTLATLGAGGLAGAVAIGALGAATVSLTLVPLVLAGAFLVLAYDLELLGGRFHGDAWFAVAWGGFPALTGYWANALTLRLPGVLVTLACVALSVAQRALSNRARELRRRTVEVEGTQRLADGREVALSVPVLLAPLERALGATALGVCLLAAAALAVRV